MSEHGISIVKGKGLYLGVWVSDKETEKKVPLSVYVWEMKSSRCHWYYQHAPTPNQTLFCHHPFTGYHLQYTTAIRSLSVLLSLVWEHLLEQKQASLSHSLLSAVVCWAFSWPQLIMCYSNKPRVLSRNRLWVRSDALGRPWKHCCLVENIDVMFKRTNAQNAEEVEKVSNTLSDLNIVASYVLLDWFKLVSKPGRCWCSVGLGALPVWPTEKCPKHFQNQLIDQSRETSEPF